MPEKKCTACLLLLPVEDFYRRRRGLQHHCKNCQRARLGKTKRKHWLDVFWGQVDRTGACWLWTGSLNSHGYGYATIADRGQERCHRISYEIAFGPIPAGACVLHLCHNRRCVRPEHLHLGDRTMNSAEMVAAGRSLVGSNQPNAKLTEADVLAIRASAESSRVIAPGFGISARTVRRIRQGLRWRHV